MAGSAFTGRSATAIAPGIVGNAGAYGLVAMAAALGGAATRAPITAVVIIFELTGEYGIILPLMLAVAMAGGVPTHLREHHTRKLLRLRIEHRPRAER